MHHTTMSHLRLSGLTALTCAALTVSSATATAECKRDHDALSLANEADSVRPTNLDAAIEKYERAVLLAPSQHRILYKLALAYVRREAWQAVVRVTERAMKLAPTFANYASTRGLALARMAAKGDGTWAEARAALEGALALDDGDADAHLELGDALLHLDEERGALKHYDRAARIAPDRSAGYLSLADLYLRLGFVPQAEKTLTEGLRLTHYGGTTTLLLLLGRIAEAKHDPTGALARYEEAKHACGACTEHGQQIVFFELGAAYASATPPRKAEAMANLGMFSKLVCKGALAARYADPCTQAYEIATRLGGLR